MTDPILAIDPGPTKSAWVLWDSATLGSFAKEANEEVLERVRSARGNTSHYVMSKSPATAWQ
jgi:hypothetical protein